MRIAIIHHHLYPGGVTRVIESQIQALFRVNPEISISLHSGTIPFHDAGINQIRVYNEPALQYLPGDITRKNAETIIHKMASYLDEIAKENDILHFHNLNLGKNPLLTLAAYHLAKRGVCIVNHCHDFAEDRPGNFAFLQAVIQDFFKEDLQKVLYPDLENYYYAVLTRHDFKRLNIYGISDDRIVVLPNAITFKKMEREGVDLTKRIKENFSIKPSLKICLYPVRGIQRKNIGEFILLSVLFGRQSAWMITQPPKNPSEIVFYDQWKKFCKDNKIPVIFEAGEIADIADLLSAADFCITTSIMEGFGMAFLEPWLAGVPVIGRNISYITDELKQNGIQLPLLYDQFVVSYRSVKTDFKDLNISQQQDLIHEIIINNKKEKELFTLNSFLQEFLRPVSPDLIRKNQQIILSKYSLENYGHQLYAIYKKLSGKA
jgi:glycosyltransferase involved in cell wall biosynthesis